MRNLILPLAFIAIALGFFYGCKKSATLYPAISPNVLQIQEARDYFESKVAHSSSTPSNPSPRTAGSKSPVWEQAQVMQLSNFKGVVVPLHYNETLFLSGDFSGNKRYALNGLARLLMYKDTAGAYHSEIVTRLPDSNYTGKTGAPFTGMLLVEDWYGHVLFRYMDDGKTIRMEPDQSEYDLSAGQRRVTTLSTYLICSQIYGYNSAGGETVYWSESGGCNYITMPNTQMMNFINISRVAGGGGGGGTATYTDRGNILDGASLNFVFDNIAGIDLLKYFKCFSNVSDAGASYSITLCADIPVNDNPDALLSSSFRPGHTFLILTKTNGSTAVSRSFGFYPQNGLLSVSSLPLGSKIVDDGVTLHEYNASISMNNISQVDFQAAQYMAENLANSSYGLNTFNCTNYAVDVFNYIRPTNPINVPNWIGAYTGINFGATPNSLYKVLSGMQYNSNGTRNFDVTIGIANAPYGFGPCN